jgi:hypothetical protein
MTTSALLMLAVTWASIVIVTGRFLFLVLTLPTRREDEGSREASH